MERGDLHPPRQLPLVHHLRQRPRRPDVLDLGLERGPDGLQDLVEEGDALALPGVQGAQFVECPLGDETRAVRRAVHGRVVHDDESAVLAQMQIEFDDVQTRLLGGDEGPEGVLGGDTHDSAVTDGEEVQGSTRFRRQRRGAASLRPSWTVSPVTAPSRG